MTRFLHLICTSLVALAALFLLAPLASAADVSVTAASVALVSGQQQTGTAGTTITAGQALYTKAADGKLYTAQATASATATFTGVALNNASSGQPVVYIGVLGGGAAAPVINIGGTVTVGQVYVVSAANPGGIAPYADLASTNYVTVIGVATTSSQITITPIVSGVVKP